MRTLGTKTETHRVFQLGPECYILYLGSDKDDDDPFIRIGNSPELPDLLHKITSKIILTSSYTGNPFLEVQYARNHKLSYLGDVDIIEHFRKFFQGLQLPARELNDYRQVKTRENRHTLYFYNNGNIHLNFDETLIFDLHKREKLDNHSYQMCDSVKELFLKNPLRYTREELNKSGFFISENGKFYLIHKSWTSLDLEDQYFGSLASQGIDPDEVNSVFTYLSEEEMGQSEREALVQIIKRRTLRNKNVTVMTTNKDITDHLLHLFPDGQNTTAVRPFLMESGQVMDERGMSAVVKENTLSINFSEKHNLIVPHDSSGKGVPRWAGWHISYDRKTLTHRNEKEEETELKTLKGFPLLLENTLPKGSSIVSKYLTFLHTYLESWEGRDAWTTLYDLEDLTKSILDGAKVNGAGNVPDLEIKTPGLEYIFLHNVIEILKQYAHPQPTVMISHLSRIMEKMPDPSSLMPVLGDLFTGKKGPFILYRISSSKLNPHNLRKAEDICEEMKKLQTPNSSFFQSEKERLQNLLEYLYGTGPAISAYTTAPKAVEKKKETSKTTSSESPKTETSAAKVSAAESGPGGFGQKPSVRKPPAKSRTKTPLLILLLILLLLALGAGAYYLLGFGDDSPRILNTETGSQVNSQDTDTNATDTNATDSNTIDSNATDTNATDSNATDSNATDSNATDSNATDSNATDSNATDSNATDSNATDSNATDSNATDSTEPIVETERRPQNTEEALAYLEIDDLTITLVDIHLVSNDIAVKSGFHDLDYRVPEGNNPDWIHSGNELIMPDDSVYEVKRGDSIWFIASRLIRRELETDLNKVSEIESKLISPNLSELEKNVLTDELLIIADRTMSEQLRSKLIKQYR